MRKFNTDFYLDSNSRILIDAKDIFTEQLNTLEGEDVFINDNKKTTRVLIQNTLNPMNENKEERSIKVTIDTKLKRGDYIRYNDIGEDMTYIVFSRVDNHKSHLKAKLRFCNQTLMCDGQPYPIKCVADNTTYGTKGIKDNGYYEERDDRLKVWVQKNEWTDRYKENMRFIFDNKIVYEVTKINGAILDGLYVMEMILSTLRPGLDKPELNIADNNEILEPVNKTENKNNTNIIKPSMNLKLTKLSVNKSTNIAVQPNNAALEIKGECAKLEKLEEGLYKLTGIKAGGYVKLILSCENRVIEQKAVLIY
ncbi:hypothetical protein ACSW9O_16065 (plasmid) [Clostridium perfringens]